MTKLLEPILLKEIFFFNGSIDQLNEKIRLHNDKKFRTEWSEYDKFKFVAHWSFGILSLRGFPSRIDGIRGFAELSEFGENQTKVELKTEVRIELYFFLIISTLLCVIGLATQEDFPLGLFFIIPFGLLWFWFVYRMQEKVLFEKLRNYIKAG